MKVLIVLTFCIVYVFCGSILTQRQPEIKKVVGGYSGSCTTSRYWDCCKPTCSWKGNTNTDYGPVRACSSDGYNVDDGNTESGCVGGSSYMCNNQQSVVINSTLAYGFAAAMFISPPENMCCTCFLLSFQKGEWGDCSGKQMVVQITNTGAGSSNSSGDQNNIEVAMPGGGVGYYTEGCKTQWNAPDLGWGDQYGGVTTEDGCYELPTQLQDGCKFRWEFLNGCSNPPATFEQVVCPQEIVDISGCKMDPVWNS
ncbi:endoglucanase-like [Sitophilus oryzae]|uniref:cellulase n=1 Tax=Sitophilus oryzae TaxID=7048 RepID=E7CIN8_SITOR|nr:endoglucanase-like [Sitophilus oryzae]XP_030763223.1 endoglucanase-like [Sitophilus oryzae]XP_030763224.1 endoglucanase-like [Sitophilus oryzae]ADU33250.1 endo-beta-1,4-glucanase [Sitophilus oryzae]